MSPVRVGLLGAGRIARRFHLPLLASMPGVELAAIADPDPRARDASRAIAPGARLHDSFDELLAAGPLDAAVVCLPPALHAPAAVACFERGMHAYVEKPLATTQDEAEAIVRAWRRAGTVGMVGFNLRFHPLVLAAKDALAQGRIGEVIAIRSTFGAARRELPSWKRERAAGGGAMLDLASHHVDLARFLLGAEVAEASALVRSAESDQDTAVASLRFSSGPLHSLCVSLASVEQDRFEIDGSRGGLAIDRYRSSRLQCLPERRDMRRSARVRAATATVAGMPAAVRDALSPPRDRTFGLALAAFVAVIRNGGATSPDLDDGMSSLVAVLAAERSAREGVRVALW